MKEAYQYRGQPKLFYNDSFDYGFDGLLATIVDDPDVMRKCASSPVVAQWGEFEPIKGHSIIHLIANGATEFTGDNRNGDGFKCAFCRDNHHTFKKHGALYRNHANRDYSKREGDIIATAFNEDLGRNELAVSASHEKCADWLSRMERGEKVAFSMGFDCDYDVCSICGHKAPTRKEYCEHVRKNASYPYGMNRIMSDGRKCYVDNPAGVWNDISQVGVGADMIAQDLRKVAGLDDAEVISGAELGEKFIGLPDSVKVAIAHKLSRMEKQVPAIGFKDRGTKRITKKVATLLREADPARMFGELASLNAVLGFRDFFKLAMGDLYTPDFAAVVDSVEPHAVNCFSAIAADTERLNRVCSNQSYRCKQAAPLLNDWERAELIESFSIDPEFAQPRLMKQACDGETLDAAPVNPLDQSIAPLLDEYAAYKLAALEACSLPMTDEVILSVVLCS